MNLDEYLKKIGCFHAKTPLTLENLTRIRTGHTNTFCFENLDMHMGIPIKFSQEDSYNRLVKNSRGGYCIQLNFILGWALQQLGYQVNYYIIYIYSKGFDQTYSIWPVHAAMVVKLNDGKSYFVDGGTTRFVYQPIEIAIDKIQKTLFGTFRFVKHDDSLGYIRLQRSKNNVDDNALQFEDQLRLKLDDPKEFEDFRNMNEYVQTDKHPMIFYRSLCQRHQGNKIIMLIGWKYSEITFDESGETRVDRMIDNIDEIRDLLRNKFNLVIDDTFRPVDNLPSL